MKRLKRWEETLNHAWARVSRGRKTLLCLILCGLLALGIWMRSGCPLPTAKLELRRWERTHLLTPGEIVFTGRENEELDLGEGLTVQLTHGVQVSVGERWAVIGEDQHFRKVALGDALTAAGFWNSALVDFSGESPKVCIPVLVFGVPAEAASGEMTVEANSGVRLTGSGGQVAEGIWLFALSAAGEQWSLDPGGAPYTIRLCREDGSLLLEQNGTL